jgi:hypothetical protein
MKVTFCCEGSRQTGSRTSPYSAGSSQRRCCDDRTKDSVPSAAERWPQVWALPSCTTERLHVGDCEGLPSSDHLRDPFRGERMRGRGSQGLEILGGFLNPVGVFRRGAVDGVRSEVASFRSFARPYLAGGPGCEGSFPRYDRSGVRNCFGSSWCSGSIIRFVAQWFEQGTHGNIGRSLLCRPVQADLHEGGLFELCLNMGSLREFVSRCEDDSLLAQSRCGSLGG